MSRLITLTTDFGFESVYVAAMKGAVWTVASDARIVDLNHSIPPQDIIAAGLFLRNVLPYFPAGCLHVVVVDPGVGTDRAVLLIEWRGSFILTPDNGCWTPVIDRDDAISVRRLNQPRFWRSEVSATFHGRDVFAPVAGHLFNGVKADELGELTSEWKTTSLSQPKRVGRTIQGEVVTMDRFGNLITNIPSHWLTNLSSTVTIADRVVGPLRRTYANQPLGSLIALISSSGHLEIAVVGGSAATTLKCAVGTCVTVEQ